MAEALKKLTEKLIKKITLDVTANLIAPPSQGGTPIDTGWARVNWVPSMTKPFKGTAGTGRDARQGDVNPADQQRGQAEILLYTLSKGNTFVTNNVPYIQKLNAGSSKQAPRAFVQQAIAKALTQDIRRFSG